MRLLRCIASVNPACGGPIEGLQQTSRVLERLGHEVWIASLDAPGDPWVRECPFRVEALGPGVGRYRYSTQWTPWLRTHGGRFDAVLVHGLWGYASLGTWRALRDSDRGYHVFTHGMLDPWFKRTHPLKHLKKWLYWPWAEYRVLRDARGVLFTCEEERRLARQSFWLYRCQERVVTYGTAAPTGHPEQQRAGFLERFPALRGKRILLFLSRVHPKKGCDLLIQAFAAVVQSANRNAPAAIQDLHLVMAGPDPVGWVARLRDLAAELGVADRITWPGMLRGEQKWGALRCADAFVLPSHQENFGIAVVEALASGVPVLLSNQVNIWREIAEAGAGWVDTDDRPGTERLLRRWLASTPAEAAQMRRAAVTCFARHFEATAAARSLLEVVQPGSRPDLPSPRIGLRTTSAP